MIFGCKNVSFLSLSFPNVIKYQLQDAILSIWANISKECFRHLVESMPRRIKAVLKTKGGQTQY